MGGRPRFLKFVRDGMHGGWDSATKAHYGLADVRELDRAWRLAHRRASPRRPAPPPSAWRSSGVTSPGPAEPIIVRAESGEDGGR